jgi:hypothetical protein
VGVLIQQFSKIVDEDRFMSLPTVTYGSRFKGTGAYELSMYKRGCVLTHFLKNLSSMQKQVLTIN